MDNPHNKTSQIALLDPKSFFKKRELYEIFPQNSQKYFSILFTWSKAVKSQFHIFLTERLHKIGWICFKFFSPSVFDNFICPCNLLFCFFFSTKLYKTPRFSKIRTPMMRLHPLPKISFWGNFFAFHKQFQNGTILSERNQRVLMLPHLKITLTLLCTSDIKLLNFNHFPIFCFF